MSRPKRWRESAVVDGVCEVSLHQWRYFVEYIQQEMLDYPSYIWRGHRRIDWLLESTFDRTARRLGIASEKISYLRYVHLKKFKSAVRGRRGANPPIPKDENEWWTLGQHHGLSTPLLDWTTSPFVAAYFAFISEGTDTDRTPRRVVYALQRHGIDSRASEIQVRLREEHRAKVEEMKAKGNHLVALAENFEVRPPVEFISPMSDENARLVSQGGLFSRAPDGADLESWIRLNFKGSTKFALIKITIPDKDRGEALKSLNRMNINHLSLFPDLYGASKFCNLALDLKRYADL